MMTYKKYLWLIFAVSILSLMTVAAVSYIADPANIYHPVADNENSPARYVEKLVTSENGILWPNDTWNERDIKVELARADFAVDCAVVGSSHVMQISTLRKHPVLADGCPSLINLGVSAGSLEDSLVMSYELLSGKNLPRTIVFEVAPWTLDFHRDAQWERYKESYQAMRNILASDAIDTDKPEQIGTKYLVNLINPFYFFRSVKQLIEQKKKNAIIEAPQFDSESGTDEPVFLPDGGLVYSREYILNNLPSMIPIGGTNYKLKLGSQVSDFAVTVFTKLVKYLNSKGVKSVILLTPYHHNVWADQNSETTKALVEVEAVVRELAQTLGVRVIGSYDPREIDCTADEFFDHMHAKDSCLAKIDF